MTAQAYKTVNELFAGRTFPPITREQSIKIANRIYRKFGNKKFASNPERFRRPKCTPNNSRRVWIDTKGVNDLNKGWRRLIHDTSHILFDRRYPNKRAHDSLHAALELEIAEYVVAEFLDKPAPVAAPVDNESAKIARAFSKMRRVLERIDQWERKKKRAETALKKLYKQRKYYARVMEG